MRTAESSPPVASTANPAISIRSAVAARFADYLELTKPRIAVLALASVVVGYTLGAADTWSLSELSHALIGIALVAAASNSLNQYLERNTDAKMARTADRPLPSGRLLPGHVLSFGLSTGIGGVVYLALFINGPTTIAAAATLLLYAAVYTPLKRVTSLCTAVGALPGALPPVLGWLAATGELQFGAFVLFAILYLWQFPHVIAIGWLYRDEYRRAKLRMLPARGESRISNGMIAVSYALVLLPISLLPSRLGLAGNLYFLTAVVLGLGYLLSSIGFTLRGTSASARALVRVSLLYLPVLLLTLLWDHFQLLR